MANEQDIPSPEEHPAEIPLPPSVQSVVDTQSPTNNYPIPQAVPASSGTSSQFLEYNSTGRNNAPPQNPSGHYAAQYPPNFPNAPPGPYRPPGMVVEQMKTPSLASTISSSTTNDVLNSTVIEDLRRNQLKQQNQMSLILQHMSQLQQHNIMLQQHLTQNNNGPRRFPQGPVKGYEQNYPYNASSNIQQEHFKAPFSSPSGAIPPAPYPPTFQQPNFNLPNSNHPPSHFPIPLHNPKMPEQPQMHVNPPMNPQATGNPPTTTPHSSQNEVNMAIVNFLTANKNFIETKSNESTTIKFPKFYGKSKDEFRTWFDQVLSILATPTWHKVFKDMPSKTLHTDDDISPTLSLKLFSALRTSVSGNAEKVMMTKPQTWGHGLLYLQTLSQTYKVSLQRADLLRKEKEYALLFQRQNETIDDFAARCITLRQQLQDHALATTDEGLRDRFIMGLGPTFTEIQQRDYEDLPSKWKTNDMQLLINAANAFKDEKLAVRDRNKLYQESNKQKENAKSSDKEEPKPQPKKEAPKPKPPAPRSTPTPSQTPSINSNDRLDRRSEADKIRQQRIADDIKSGVFNPMDYAWQVKPRCCVWHNTSTHLHPNCSSLNRLLTEFPNQQFYHANPTPTYQAPSNPNPQPRQQPSLPAARRVQLDNPSHDDIPPSLPLDEFGLEALQAATDMLQDSVDGNVVKPNTNDTVNIYQHSICRHVTSTNHKLLPEVPRPSHFVVDSGAFPHMSKDKSIFTDFTPFNTLQNPKYQFVTLADGVTKARALGKGTATIYINNKRCILNDVLYVPQLSDSLFSVKKHVQQKGHYIHFGDKTTSIAFPTFVQTIPNNQSEFLLQYSQIDTQHPTQPSSKLIKTTRPTPTKTIPPLLPISLPFRKLAPQAIKPKRSTPGSAGLDLFASNDTIIPPHTRMKINTQIAIEMPIGYYGRIAPRSGMSMTHNIDIAAGVCDCDYRGEIIPCLINNSDTPYNINAGDKIAQLIFERIALMDLHEVTELHDTVRGKGGFGRTNTLPISDPESLPTKEKTPSPSSTTWTKLQKQIHKITIKLPWNSHFSKGTLEPHPNGYIFTDIENKTFQHILPKHVIKQLSTNNNLMIGHHHLINSPSTPRVHQPSPPIRVVDKLIEKAPPTSVFTIDQLKRAFGFRNVTSIIQELKATSTNFAISTMDREPIIDIGNAANIDKSPRNTFPNPLPPTLGDIVHIDIIYGAGTAIGGTKYALFAVDKATRHKFMYPMKNLKEDVLTAIKNLVKDLGEPPKTLRTDFDHKLMGKSVLDYFIDKRTTLESAPPEKQYQNGLCERNWRSLLRMARSWLATSLLPSDFWWFALKRATEVSNYIPLKINGITTTPHQLTYNTKPDLRNLLPMFCVAYPKYKAENNTDMRTCKAILVGRSDRTHTYMFYHPNTKKIITTSECLLDERLPAGPAFNLPYDGGLFFTKYCEQNIKTRPPTFAPESRPYIKQNNSYLQVEVINVPLNDDSIYTVQYPDGSIHQLHEQYLLPNNPNLDPQEHDPRLHTFPQWIKHGSKCTMFLPTMKRPAQGTLVLNNNTWQFRPGRKHHNQPINLPTLEQTVHYMISEGQLFKGHQTQTTVYKTQSTMQLTKAVAKHVSAVGLSSPDAPHLLKHPSLIPKDKEIWDAAYSEEYFGLKNLPAFQSITEADYQANKHVYGPLLPTMAISTVKYNEIGKPVRAKYRIVVLGNLDPHQWTKSDCFSPVMSLLELRLLTAIAVRHNRTLKSGDVKQAFVQALLPPNENYILRPPPGCPHTPKQTYWKLQRTLYGLKRSPRHWFDKAASLLQQLGLKPCPNAPCIFKGEIIKGKPPLTLGLYVDDFVYFSVDDEVEKAFEEKFAKLTKVDYMGTVTHFLGIRFQWRQTPSHTQVHLSQEAFIDALLQQYGLHNISTKSNPTPYRSGYPVDSITNDTNMTDQQALIVQAKYRSIVGSLLWVSQGTRPDISTITNILSKYQNNASNKHIAAAKYVIKYLKGSKSRGISFDSRANSKMKSYLHFPIQSQKLSAMCDANWGPQDQTKPRPNQILPELPLFKTRSISGHIITLLGPVHWTSKRQRITARSSGEAEIYATDECLKDIMQIRNIIADLNLEKLLLHERTKIFNDNMACVLWSKNTTTKGLRYLQIRENAIRENQNIIEILHISGSDNPADIFSKEDKDANHYTQIRDSIVQTPFDDDNKSSTKNCLTNSANLIT